MPVAVATIIDRDSFRLKLNLEVKAGETVGLTGDIGSGKSTALWLMAGRLAATNGVVALPKASTLLSQSFQADLVEERTGVENVIDAIKGVRAIDGMQSNTHRPSTNRSSTHTDTAADPETAARLILQQIGVADHVVDRLPWTFSGAEAQRVALAMALAPRPDLVLLDEPTGALDKQGRASVADYLESWLDRFEGAAVVASTNPDLLARITDRVVTLS
ncbi:MAG: ATPase subunit of ABC transporter with duplicated ATPase domains [Acidimicrobiales bacterium]